MSKNITVDQLTGNQRAYGIDEFREMVNYSNLKNKGYVRFTLGSDGGLKLEKFNRKIALVNETLRGIRDVFENLNREIGNRMGNEVLVEPQDIYY